MRTPFKFAYVQKYLTLILCSFALHAGANFKSLDAISPNDFGLSIPKDSIQLYLDSAQKLANRFPIQAVSVINRAIELSILENDQVQSAKSYFALASVQQNLGQHALAVTNYKRCIENWNRYASISYKVSSSLSNAIDFQTQSGIFDAQYSLAFSYFKLDKLNEAEKIINDNFDLELGSIEWERVFKAKRLMAEIMASNGKRKDAVSMLDEMLHELKTRRNDRINIETLLTLGAVYESSSDLNNALKYYSIAKVDAEKVQYNDLSIRANEAMAKVYRIQGNLNQEVFLRNSNIELNRSNANNSAISNENFEIGNAYINTADVEVAEAYIIKGFDAISQNQTNEQQSIQQELSLPEPINYRSTQLQIGADAYKNLAEGFLQKNNFQKALDYYKKYSVMQDSVELARKLELQQAIELSNSLGKNQQRVDLLEKERELTNKSIDILSRDRELKAEQLSNRNLIIGALGGSILIMVIAAILMIRNIRARRNSDKLLTLQSLSGQMNPHFIFNALNSVNEYIAQNDERAANRYLSSFSKLMRQVLDDSRHTFISLNDEVEMLELYLKLEHSRFQDKFDYLLSKPNEITNSDFQLPPMIIQPFIENAIWHGLRYRDSKGNLKVSISLADQMLTITIEDDGIGMKKSAELKTKNQQKQSSLGMQNIHTRVKLMNELFDTKIRIEISDAKGSEAYPGVIAHIFIPQLMRREL
jgi:anti-sigma regulatory factor (Ser/Thr protein kinase)